MTCPMEELPQRAFETYDVVELCSMFDCAECCATWVGTMWEPADCEPGPGEEARPED